MLFALGDLCSATTLFLKVTCTNPGFGGIEMSIRMTKQEMGMLYELNNYDKKYPERALQTLAPWRTWRFMTKKKIKSSCHAKGEKKIFP